MGLNVDGNSQGEQAAYLPGTDVAEVKRWKLQLEETEQHWKNVRKIARVVALIYVGRETEVPMVKLQYAIDLYKKYRSWIKRNLKQAESQYLREVQQVVDEGIRDPKNQQEFAALDISDLLLFELRRRTEDAPTQP